MMYHLFQRSPAASFGFLGSFVLKKLATRKLRMAMVLTELYNLKSQGCSGNELANASDCQLVGSYKVVKETNLEAAGKMFCRKVLLLL